MTISSALYHRETSPPFDNRSSNTVLYQQSWQLHQDPSQHLTDIYQHIVSSQVHFVSPEHYHDTFAVPAHTRRPRMNPYGGSNIGEIGMPNTSAAIVEEEASVSNTQLSQPNKAWLATADARDDDCSIDSINAACRNRHNHQARWNHGFQAETRITWDPLQEYLPQRRRWMEWLQELARCCKLQDTTVHTAMLYLDKLLLHAPSQGLNNAPKKGCFYDEGIGADVHLMATACLSVAAKYEECVDDVPTLTALLHLSRLDQVGFTPNSFREHGESVVLEALGWKLRAFSALHILEFFFCHKDRSCDSSKQYLHQSATMNILLGGIVPPHQKASPSTYPNREITFFQDISRYLCQLTMQTYAFQQYLPSHLAAIIILLVRDMMTDRSCKRWSQELTTLTGYDLFDLMEGFHHLRSHYEIDCQSRSASYYHQQAPSSPQETQTYKAMCFSQMHQRAYSPTSVFGWHSASAQPFYAEQQECSDKSWMSTPYHNEANVYKESVKIPRSLPSFTRNDMTYSFDSDEYSSLDAPSASYDEEDSEIADCDLEGSNDMHD